METRQKPKPSPVSRLSREQLSACLIAALLLTLLIYSVVGSISRQGLKRDLTSARNQVGNAVEQNIRMFMRTYDSLSQSGANVKGDLLPKLHTYYYGMTQVDDALTYAFGKRYGLISEGIRNSLNSALSAYDTAFSTGKSTDSAYQSLSEAVTGLNTVLATRFDRNGDVRPAK